MQQLTDGNRLSYFKKDANCGNRQSNEVGRLMYSKAIDGQQDTHQTRN